jgi:aspartyl-tRNA(Asn)/glutamyl-tRNA(Gln) amidotransferase subunit A
MNLAFKNIEELKELIKSGETTSREIWNYFMKRVEKYEPKVQAFNFINQNGLNESNEILGWIPLWIKDIFCENGVPTTAASKMLENFVPPYDATVIKKLKDAGMSSLGKCNMDEFAMGSSTENSAFKKTLNPWGTNRIPGGSSGGSAAAVAAGLVPAALWTDTWWSIRQPASLCWVVGFKPSYGRNSRFWVMAMASSLDCPGTFTRTVKDAATLYEIMNGEDRQENTTYAGHDTIDNTIWQKTNLQGKKIGIPKEYFEDGLDAGVRETINQAIQELKNLWAEIIDISLSMTKYAMATYYIICPAEVATNLARLDGIRYGHSSQKPHENLEEFYVNNRGEWLGAEPKRRSILGSYVLSAGFYDAYYKKASQVRTLIIKDFENAFAKVDAIVCPVSPSVAWKVWEKTDDPLKMYLSDAYTIPASMAGIPWISVPCGFAKSEDTEQEVLPVGLQILTPMMQEERLFEIAHIYEQKTKWYEKMIPSGFDN